VNAPKMMSRLAVAVVVAGLAAAASAGNASAATAGRGVAVESATGGGIGVLEAPVGKQCGAYRDSPMDYAHLRYWHCGPTQIRIEVDKRNGPNYTTCVGPWQDVFVDHYIFASHAWYVGAC
jgi:hypothetical protein